MKDTWGNINKVLGKKKGKIELPQSFQFNNQTLNDPQEIANKFNTFFANVGLNLANKIDPPIDKTYSMYLKSNINSSFTFKPVLPEDIIKVISKNLKPKNTCGIDGISSNMLKSLTHSISMPIANLINQCIETGVFPDKLKIAKVLPLHKKDAKDIFDNYRPISILPSISKIFERVIFNQIHEYFHKNKLYYNHQHGFRENHSCDTASTELIDMIMDSIDKHDIPICVSSLICQKHLTQLIILYCYTNWTITDLIVFLSTSVKIT